jgi:3-amino-4-hydroxybenzoic acid synthase
MTNVEKMKRLKTGNRVFWYDGRHLKKEELILPLVYNLRYEYLLIKQDMVQEMKTPRKIKLIVDVDESDGDLGALSNETVVFSANGDRLRQAAEMGYQTALYRKIRDQEDMDSAWRLGKSADYLVVELTDETNIPLELLIARLQDQRTVLLKMVNSRQDAEIALGVMEAGSDGVVLQTEDIHEIQGVDRLMAQAETGQLELVIGKVTEVQHIGMGYRVCIDTTTIMERNEGMIIGSTSDGGLLISSETHFLPYMELRPFRVNAGAVHSYVWAPDGMTAYLTELKGGSKVICVDTRGNTRTVSVGRAKIEARPLLKIEVEAGGVKVNAIVQDDWHIRIFGGDGEVRNASTIKAGDELLTYLCPGGRHVGIKINEMIEEK